VDEIAPYEAGTAGHENVGGHSSESLSQTSSAPEDLFCSSDVWLLDNVNLAIVSQHETVCRRLRLGTLDPHVVPDQAAFHSAAEL
jgi:hypothetical protein